MNPAPPVTSSLMCSPSGSSRARSMVARVLEVRDLTKRYGAKLAVDGLSFSAQPGRVLGFLGPNGAGKTTTLRVLLGLTLPTSGETAIDSQPYRNLKDPIRVRSEERRVGKECRSRW